MFRGGHKSTSEPKAVTAAYLPFCANCSPKPLRLTLRNEAISLCWKLSAALPKLKLFRPAGRSLSLSPPMSRPRAPPIGELVRRNLSMFSQRREQCQCQLGIGAEPRLAGQDASNAAALCIRRPQGMLADGGSQSRTAPDARMGDERKRRAATGRRADWQAGSGRAHAAEFRSRLAGKGREG